MQNFDENKQAEREFQVGGEKFRWRYVRPETLALLARQLHSDNGGGAADVADDGSTPTLRHLDEQVMVFLDSDEAKERWRNLRLREEDPVTSGQLQDIVIWLVEQQSVRPTETPSPSAPGRGRTAATSKAG